MVRSASPRSDPDDHALVDSHGDRYGNAFLLEPAPDNQLPEHGMRAVDAMRLIGEELVLDGIPMRNLATFVTTWMEPEAQRIIAENLHRNFIDHAEYPQTAEIEQRCIRMLADLFHAPGETTGARTQGSSEAIMLGALSLKWKWRAAPRGGRQGHGPAEPRVRRRRARRVGEVLPLLRRRAADHPAAARQVHDRARGRRAARRREHDRRRRRAGHDVHRATPTTSSASTTCWSACATRRGLDVPLHVDGASGGFVWPFLYPDSEWDFRLEQVRSINVSGHKYGLVYPGIGWLVFREKSDLAEDLVFYENYLGKTDATFTLNFSTGSAMVLAQYYNFVRFGHDGYRYIMETMQANARALAERIADIGEFELVGRRRAPSSSRSSPSSSRATTTTTSSTSPRSSPPSAAGWCPPTRCRRTPQHVTIMRALVKLTLGHTLASTLADDIAAGVRDARQEGRPARARPPAREDGHGLLSSDRDLRGGRLLDRGVAAQPQPQHREDERREDGGADERGRRRRTHVPGLAGERRDREHQRQLRRREQRQRDPVAPVEHVAVEQQRGRPADDQEQPEEEEHLRHAARRWRTARRRRAASR